MLKAYRCAIVAAMSLIMATTTSIAHAAPPPVDSVQWSAPSLLDPQSGGLLAIDCPTATYCAAVDRTGGWLTDARGAWSRSPTPLADADHLSCPAAQFCFVSNAAGDVAVVTSGRWHRAVSVLPGAEGTAISCATTRFCVAVGGNGQVSSFDGSVWSTPVALGAAGLTAVSCVSSTLCAAVDDQNVVYQFDGTTWRPTTVPDLGDPTSVSCTSDTFCVVVDLAGSAATWNGQGWTVTRDVGQDGFSSVSCVSNTYCVATDEVGNYVEWSGSWGSPQPAGVDRVSCTGPGRCVFLSGGDSVRYLQRYQLGTAVLVDPIQGNPTAASCATPTSCVLLDAYGNAFTLDGSTWSAPTAAEQPFVYSPSAVSCPSSGVCVATTSFCCGDRGKLLTYNGAWHETDPAPLDLRDVSCVSRTFCVLVGHWAQFIWNGASVSATGPQVYVDATSVSCVSKMFCVLADRQGRVSTWNGSIWSAPATIDASTTQPGYVSCASASFCMVVGGDGNAESWNGTAWSHPVPMDAVASPTAVSCTGARSCVAVDDGGAVVPWQGGAWATRQVTDAGRPLATVSCAGPTFCLAADSDGYVITRSAA